MEKDLPLGQATKEQVLTTVRQSWAGLVPALIIPVAVVIVCFLFLFPIISVGPFGVGGFFIVVICAALYIVRHVFVWQRQTLLITTKRIVDRDQRGFFKRTVSSFSLACVQDSYYETSGIWHALSRSANIVILVNGGKTKIAFKNATQPARALKVLQEVCHKNTVLFNGKLMTMYELRDMLERIKSRLSDKKFRDVSGESPTSEIADEE